MTWTININGHDDLSGDEKTDLENMLVEEAREFVDSLKERKGMRVTTASISTNTTGPVNLMEESKASG